MLCPFDPRFRRQMRDLREAWRGMHSFGASGTISEAALGPAQFKLSTPEAILHVPSVTRAPQ
eukprot:4490660-Alexandrium_andersonii.AAC.1